MRVLLLFILFSASQNLLHAQTLADPLLEKVSILNQGVEALRSEEAISSFIKDLDWDVKMAQDRDWKPAYYAALARLQYLFYPGFAHQNASALSQELEQRLAELANKFDHAEIFALRAYFHLMQAKGGGQALPEELVGRIREDLVKAQSRQFNSPRAMLVSAYLEVLQSKAGSDLVLTVSDLRPMAEGVLQQFQVEAASVTDPLLPTWGRKQAEELLRSL